MQSPLWYKSQQRLKLGDVCRYIVEYTTDNPEETIYLRVKNSEKSGLRPVNMLIGPLVLYCHVVPCQYDQHLRFLPEKPKENREVCFRNTLAAGQTFNVKLELNENSLYSTNANGTKTYQWECQMTSQILINLRLLVSFLMAVGSDLQLMRRATRSLFTSISKGDFSGPDTQTTEWETLTRSGLSVKLQKTDDLWLMEPKNKEAPVHLVIITHGIFSNLTADMLYVRDAIANTAENVIVTGFRGNAGRTEKGVHRLGLNVSNFVSDTIDELQDQYTVGSISFVAHSLGGPVQLYALKHLLLVKGTDYFDQRNIRLRNFVCLASPMLGVLSEMSLWILWFLDLGTLGKTGRDLTLLKKTPRYLRHLSQQKRDLFRPILETLPDEPMRTLLAQFDQRVVYANAVHDGIVPLRTSALLYLDWVALGDVNTMREQPLGEQKAKKTKPEDSKQERQEATPETLSSEVHSCLSEVDSRCQSGSHSDIGRSHSNHSEIHSNNGVGEIPADAPSDIKSNFERLFASLFSSDNNEQGNGQLEPRKTRRIKNKVRKYARISAKGSDTKLASESPEKESSESYSDDVKSLNIPPKASALESVLNTLICPIPSEDYITTPESRPLVIFHDKYYHFDHAPDHENHIKGLKKLLHFTDWKIEKQVRIARKYHAPQLSWRKVLTCLPPDAHNNIVVRRRFANGYGWGVIDHLANEVFAEKVRAKM